MKIKPLIYALFILLLSLGFALSIADKEKLLKNGSVFYLKLTPVDPRSLMQGDYMILNYDAILRSWPQANKALMQKDALGIASVQGPYNGQKTEDNQFILKVYKSKFSTGRIAPDSFFFQEGQAQKYQQAKYALLKHDGKGNALLISLTDQDLNIL